MSEEKKSPEGKPHQEGQPMDGKAKEAAGPPRARNQDALPGILGKQLRAAYGEWLNAPVPDAITDLIKQLEQKDPGKKPNDPGAAHASDPADEAGRKESGQ